MSIRERPSKKAPKGVTYQVYFDYTDKYGQNKTYIKGGFLKKKDAENHETLKKAELITTGDVYKVSQATVDEVYKLYKESAPLKKSTMQMYDNKYKNYIGPLFGKYKIALIDNWSLLKLLIVRIILFVFVIIGFFVFFPHLMADKVYMIAVLLYFMCPTGFALPMQIAPLFKSEEDGNYTSAFISLNMIITLIVYTIIVIFIA